MPGVILNFDIPNKDDQKAKELDRNRLEIIKEQVSAIASWEEDIERNNKDLPNLFTYVISEGKICFFNTFFS